MDRKKIMIADLLNNGYCTLNKKFETPQQWINFCEDFMLVRQYKNFWSSLPGTEDKIMLLGTEKINNRDCYVSRPNVFLDWHYDGIGIVNPEELICLYCVIPNSVTSVCNLHQMYIDAPHEIKNIVHSAVLEIMRDNDVYDTNKRERVGVIRVQQEYEKESYRPMLQIHPITGKRSMLYGNTFVSKLHGVTKTNAKLFHEYYNDVFDKYVYKHYWNENDILIIDQRMSIHARDAHEGERKMWRSGGWYK